MRITRIEVVAAVLLSLTATGKVFAQADRPEVPTHADPVEQGVQEHVNRLCASHRARLAAISTEAALKAEIEVARKKFLERLDLDLDTPRAAPSVRRIGTLDFPEYRIEKLIVESAPGVPVPCNVYVPKSGPSRKPALLSPHGHSGRDRPNYQNAYQRFAKSGFVVLAKDGWGKQERRRTGHETRGGQLFLTGSSLMSLELWDNVRCLDHLLSRDDVDPERIGMTGVSGGGSQTLYAAAADPRIKAASPTCAVTSLQADLADTTMCICELATDLLNVGDQDLFLAMAYPRPVFVVNGTHDRIFPIAGARASVRHARALYGAGGRAERVAFFEADAPHAWNDEMLSAQIRWFRERFGLPPLDDLPPGDGFRQYDQLQCYADGDLPAETQTISQFNRLRMRKPDVRPQSDRADQRRVLAEMLTDRWSGPPTLPERVATTEWSEDSAKQAEKMQCTWRSGLGGDVSISVSRPLDPRLALEARRRIVLRLHDESSTTRLERYYWNDRIRTHATVVELRDTGRSLDARREGQVATALLSSGRSLLSERLRDLLVALAVVKDRGLADADAALTIFARGYDADEILIGSVLLPSQARLALDECRISWRDGAELDFTSADLTAETAHWTILPRLASRFDLSELVSLAGPDRITFYHPLDAARRPVSATEAGSLLRAASGMRIFGRDEPPDALWRHLNETAAKSTANAP